MSELGEKNLFNSPLETGLRSVILLDEAYPQEYDLTTLTWLDYLVVHTSDIDGPISLHPDITFRSGELLVRRKIIEDGLLLMRQIHLVKINENEKGIFYSSTDYAKPVIGLLYEQYTVELKQRAKWLVDKVRTLKYEEFKRLINERMGLWDIEFQLREGMNYEY